jgi:hypothetical protein
MHTVNKNDTRNTQHTIYTEKKYHVKYIRITKA